MRKLALPLLLPVLGLVSPAVLHAQQHDLHSMQQQLAWATGRLQMTGFLVTALLLFLMGAGCLALWWSARSHKAFGTVGFYLIAISAVFFAEYFESWRWNDSLILLSSMLLIESAADCLRIEKRRWIVPVRLFFAAALVVSWIPGLSWTLHLPIELSKVLVPVLLVVRLRRPLQQDRFILPAIAIVAFFRLPLDNHYPGLSRLPYYFSVGGWRWYYGPLTTVVFGATAITVLVRELILDQRVKQRMAAELGAGRAVQQVLLGTETPSIPGFLIEFVYKPAGEVGGDFFQILPGEQGALLIVIGDVSGKGLKAAMTVSAIVGALRGSGERRPAQVLPHLNRVLCGQIGGFVTCCATLIGKDGSMTMANAGHLAPYVSGREIEVESGLPLGISPDSVYTEQTIRLEPGDQLTLLTDGVVEAQSPTGELYGFERTAQISARSAEAIAQAAQQFGQEDDITVLTLTYAPAEVLHA